MIVVDPILGLTFDPILHKYYLKGEEVPGVSEIKKPLVDFSMVDSETLARAGRFGTSVHKMCELYLSNELDYSSLDESLYGPLEAFERWLDEVKPFAGRPALIDIKSRKYDRVADPVQLAAYNQLVQENDIREVTIERPLASIKYRFAGTPDIIVPAQDGGIIADLRILYLGLDGKYTYTRAYDPNAWPIFGRLLGDYWRRQETEKLLSQWRKRI